MVKGNIRWTRKMPCGRLSLRGTTPSSQSGQGLTAQLMCHSIVFNYFVFLHHVRKVDLPDYTVQVEIPCTCASSVLSLF